MHNKLIVYPSGKGGQDTAQILKFYGFEPIMMDDNPSDKSDVLTFEGGLKYALENNLFIVVASDNYGELLIEKLKNKGFKKYIKPEQFIKNHINKKLLDVLNSQKGSGEVIAFFAPRYKKHIGNIAEMLESMGKKIVFLTQFHDDAENKFYKNRAVVAMWQHFKMLENIDLIFLTEGATIPSGSKSIFFPHALDYSSGLCLNMDKTVAMDVFYQNNYMLSDYFFASCKSNFELVASLYKHVKDYFKDNDEKCVIPGGYPSFDQNYKKYNDYLNKPVEKDTILYAPTPDYIDFENTMKFSSLNKTFPHLSKAIIETLVNNFPEYRIVFRIHPLHRESGAIESILEAFKYVPNFEYDDGTKSYIESFRQSVFMISDVSSVAYNFPLSTLHPVIFFNPEDFPDEVKAGAGTVKIGYIYYRKHVGEVVKNTDELLVAAKIIISGRHRITKDELSSFRDKFMYNIGESEKYIVDNIEYILNGKKHPDWCYI